jgi:hypothetical protein
MENDVGVTSKPSSKDISEKTEEDAYKQLGISWFLLWVTKTRKYVVRKLVRRIHVSSLWGFAE